MKFISTRGARRRLGGFAALLLAASPASAHARSFVLFLDVQIAPALGVLLGVGSNCIGVDFDTNGNRTAQSISTIGSGATLWGSGAFGCFVWTQ